MLLAGEGTRMRPLTYTKPKPLLKVAGQTLIGHNLENLNRNGIDDIVVVVGYLQNEIKNLLKDFKGFNFKFVLQNERLGTGHALLEAKDFIESETFMVMCGDDIYHHDDIKRVLNNDLCVTAKEVGNPQGFGVFTLENGFVKNLIEKPSNHVSNLANTGLYVLNKDIFNLIQSLKKSQRNEIELTDSVLHMSKEQSIKCEITNNWIPIGYPWDLLTANEIKMRELDSENFDTSFIEKNVTTEGIVKVGKNTKIKNGAYIEGPVIIGDNCVVGPNCYIRSNSVVGNGCRLGNGAEIKNTLIGNSSNIEHFSYIGDSIIGNNCNLGAGTITANLRHDNKTIRVMVKGEWIDTRKRKFGVVLGDWTKTGIHTSLYQGIMMGPFSWTSPSITVKENIEPLTLFDGSKKNLDASKFENILSPHELERLKSNSEKYAK